MTWRIKRNAVIDQKGGPLSRWAQAPLLLRAWALHADPQRHNRAKRSATLKPSM